MGIVAREPRVASACVAVAAKSGSTGSVSSPQALGESHHRLLDGGPESSRQVRAAVSEIMTTWGSEGLVDDAVLCAAELASNAILHAATNYELVVRRLPEGACIEIVDRRPDLVPTAVPASAHAYALEPGGTGRGLQIVANLASRWGYTTSATSKSVWIEVTENAPAEPSEPVVVEGHHEISDPTAVTFLLESLPVRAAIGSGVHVEELVREIQLASRSALIDDPDLVALRELLDMSAPARLLGRHAAFSAAAQEHARFSVEARLSPAALSALVELNAMLTQTSTRFGATVVPLPDDVIAFREWVAAELARQAAGHAPAPCPLPD